MHNKIEAKVWEKVEEEENKEQSTAEDEKEKKGKAQILQIIEEVTNTEAIFFHDQNKTGYVALKGDGREILKIDSKLFRQWLSERTWRSLKKIPSINLINNAIQALEGRAIFDGKTYELNPRVCRYDDAIWYDIGDGQPSVRIVKEGWSIIKNPPILFRRYAHQVGQVAPERGGNIKDLYSFINLPTDEWKLLFLVCVIATFIPGFPHAIPVFHGPQGSGKTTPLKLLKSLADPSLLKTMTIPTELKEFIQLASHHWFLFFDNVTSLSDWQSDALSKACTGDGFSKRGLYTDDDDIIYSFQRPIGLNGIPLVVQKADLLDRSILLGLERIPKEKRREEEEFWEEFNKKKPYFLGAIFDTVAKALELYSAINLKTRPRMADFTRWGCAISIALGYNQEQFLVAYYENINEQNNEAIEANPVGPALLSFIEKTFIGNRDEWEGSPTELFSELDKVAESLKIKASRNWPKNPAALSKKLLLIQSNLADEGIIIVRDDKARPRKISIKKDQKDADAPDMVSQSISNEIKDNKASSLMTDAEVPIPTPPTVPTQLLAPEISILENASLSELNAFYDEHVKWLENCPAPYRTSNDFDRVMDQQARIVAEITKREDTAKEEANG